MPITPETPQVSMRPRNLVPRSPGQLKPIIRNSRHSNEHITGYGYFRYF